MSDKNRKHLETVNEVLARKQQLLEGRMQELRRIIEGKIEGPTERVVSASRVKLTERPALTMEQLHENKLNRIKELAIKHAELDKRTRTKEEAARLKGVTARQSEVIRNTAIETIKKVFSNHILDVF